MPLNSSQICDIDSSFIGLIGVVLGAAIIIVKDTIQNFIVKRKDKEYLAIRVTCLLEHFSGGCVEVVGDDGLCYGQRNEGGCLEPQIRPPQLSFDNLDVKWKSLSRDLMYELLNFPNEIDKANQIISFTSEYISSPPDYEEFFEEREFHYY